MTKDKRHFNILVVEDNIGDFTLIEDYLEEYFLAPNVQRAVSFKEAKQYFTNRIKLDLVLLDLTLPDKSGEELILDILNLDRKIPFIVLTGYTDINFAVKSMSLGISDYLLKDELSAITLYKSIIYCVERHKALVLLQESEKRYSDLFHLSPLPKWVVDLETGHFLDVNQSSTYHFGYSFEEFLEMKQTDLLAKDSADPALDPFYSMKIDSELLQDYTRYQKKNGTIVYVDVTASERLFKFKGRAAQMVVASDVTEKLKHVNAIEEQNIKLREIAWTQSHKVRSPLARIMGLAHLITTDKVTSEEKNDLLIQINVSALEMDAVIKEIVDKTYEIDLKANSPRH